MSTTASKEASPTTGSVLLTRPSSVPTTTGGGHTERYTFSHHTPILRSEP